MLEYNNFEYGKLGLIYHLLKKIYKDYPFLDKNQKNNWISSWKEYDKLVFQNLDTVGRSGFFSHIDTKVIGFCSWDPRKGGDEIIVGHNGIIPEYRGNGFGRKQIEYMIYAFKELGYKKAYVTTGEEKFFYAAQQNYISCGFTEKDRFSNGIQKLIKYEINIR